ncbi:prepilin-type N-terminal cleavage/methylation domain-containing protein [Lacimicrobium sp. SS2-24]|uniref:type II secretion system protein n=1 Tax=Lacimicrobium sp. SS2-24 TaxID=2005569 RepID=UPI000B4BE431|nr:prepilin-type N-terminal cleavage/methylation domain-containing protein [Lacimicrobium sp. SS2-24]
MMSVSRNGFTLIELLVVITIMMTVMGLVGGLTVDMLDKYKVKSEQKQVFAILNALSQRAFVLERTYRVQFADSMLIGLDEQSNQPVIEQSFESIRFPKQSISLNRQGLPSQESLFIRVEGESKRLSLDGVLRATP